MTASANIKSGATTHFSSNAKPKTLVFRKQTQFLVAHLRQWRIHHHDKADGDRDKVVPTCKLLSAAGIPGMR